MMMMKPILLPRTIVRCTNYFSSTPSSAVPPWLMSSSAGEDNIESRRFYSLTEKKIVHESRLPEISGHRLIGSSQGHLLTLDHDRNLVATNPLRSGPGARIPLPPTSSLPDVKDCTHMTAEEKHHYISLILRETHAVLSPGARAAVAVYEPRMCQSRLAFARAGDQNWTALECSGSRPWDMIFRKGLLHTVDGSGAVSIYDLDRPSDPPFVSSPVPPENEHYRDWRYLVESPRGDDLFLVSEIMDGWRGDPDEEDKIFRVYVLDKTTYTWKWMKNLGDVALFVGLDHSTSLYTPDFPGIKSNCIYFARGNKEGIYSLKDDGIESVYSDDDQSDQSSSDDDHDQFEPSSSMWFVPVH